MKYFTLVLIALVFAGCTGNDIEISGTADGIANGTITVKDASGQTLSGANLKDGNFHIAKTHLDNPGYGSLVFSRPGQDDKTYELYLEPGTYTITFDKVKTGGYPQVKTSSNIQNQLSAYKQLQYAMSLDAAQKVQMLDAKYNEMVKSTNGWTDSTTALTNSISAQRKNVQDIDAKALLAYINKNPQNQIAAHVMQSMSMDLNPTAYYAVYKKFNPAQQNSDEGKEIADRLKVLIRLQPGAVAPAIAGTQPNGKSLDLKSLHKKLILVEFWKAGNFQGRLNHQAMFKSPQPPFMNNKDLGIVSVSFDKKRDWWLGSTRDDKLTWPQVSDLKGSDSPNWANWDIQDLPSYCLLDGTGHVVERDLQFQYINHVVDKYLKAH